MFIDLISKFHNSVRNNKVTQPRPSKHNWWCWMEWFTSSFVYEDL